jgi:hypothetical protein
MANIHGPIIPATYNKTEMTSNEKLAEQAEESATIQAQKELAQQLSGAPVYEEPADDFRRAPTRLELPTPPYFDRIARYGRVFQLFGLLVGGLVTVLDPINHQWALVAGSVGAAMVGAGMGAVRVANLTVVDIPNAND